jgi:hypothetical protein
MLAGFILQIIFLRNTNLNFNSDERAKCLSRIYSGKIMLHNKTIENLLDIKEIYLEPEIRNYTRGLEILAKYPEVNIIEVPSH